MRLLICARRPFIAAAFLIAWAVSTGTGVRAEDVRFPSDARVVDVKALYGAKGDGVTDDTPAIFPERHVSNQRHDSLAG